MQWRTVGVSLIVALLAMPLVRAAQAQQPRPEQREQTARQDTMPMMMPRMMAMMGAMRGMHQQIMQDPMHRAGMMVYALPALADTLGLSDEQREQLRQRKQQFITQQRMHRQEMQALQKQFAALFEGDAPPEPDAVRDQLQAQADLRVEQQAARYEAAAEMREVLTDEQREALDRMEPRALYRQLMANMTMQEMMQMMRALHGGGMMGPGGPGMMPGMPMTPGERPRMRRNPWEGGERSLKPGI